MSSIGPVVSEEKMFENVDGRRTDGRRSHWYTISSPMSLRSGELIRPKIDNIFKFFHENIFAVLIESVSVRHFK